MDSTELYRLLHLEIETDTEPVRIGFFAQIKRPTEDQQKTKREKHPNCMVLSDLINYSIST